MKYLIEPFQALIVCFIKKHHIDFNKPENINLQTLAGCLNKSNAVIRQGNMFHLEHVQFRPYKTFSLNSRV